MAGIGVGDDVTRPSADKAIAEILRLDGQGDLPAVAAYLESANIERDGLLLCLYTLLVQARFQSALVVAKMVSKLGHDHPLVALAFGLCGAIFGNKGDETEGSEGLVRNLTRLNPDQRKSFWNGVAKPILIQAAAVAKAGEDYRLVAKIAHLRRDASSGVEPPLPYPTNPTPAEGAAVAAPISGTMRLEVEKLSLVLADLQQKIPYAVRESVGQMMIGATNHVLPKEWRRQISEATQAQAREIDAESIIRLDDLLSPREVEAAINHLTSRPCFEGQVPAKEGRPPLTIADCIKAKHSHASYLIRDVLEAPKLFETANRQDILDLAEGYLGCTPTLYSMNAFWTFPDPTKQRIAVQTFHRDHDDFRFCTIFLFLTKTTATDGAHYIIRGTHRIDTVERAVQQYELARSVGSIPSDPSKPLPTYEIETLFSAFSMNMNEACTRLFPDRIETVTADAGSAVMEDTYAIHKGDIPKTPRLVVWMRYGLYKGAAGYANQIRPVPAASMIGRIPDTPYHRYVNRVLVEPSE